MNNYLVTAEDRTLPEVQTVANNLFADSQEAARRLAEQRLPWTFQIVSVVLVDGEEPEP